MLHWEQKYWGSNAEFSDPLSDIRQIPKLYSALVFLLIKQVVKCITHYNSS